jgi:hypothetical protein
MKYNDNNKFSNGVKTRIIIEKNYGSQWQWISDAHSSYMAFKRGISNWTHI